MHTLTLVKRRRPLWIHVMSGSISSSTFGDLRLAASGERLGLQRIVNEPLELAQVIGLCGEAPQVVIEATYGWYWAVDLLQELGAVVHLGAPVGRRLGRPTGQERRERRDAISRTCCG